MLNIGYLIILDGQKIKKISFGNSIAFGKYTSQRISPKQRRLEIGKKRHKYGLKHDLHTPLPREV